jgi:hypothetical protein
MRFLASTTGLLVATATLAGCGTARPVPTAAVPAGQDSVRVAAGSAYERGLVHRLLWGRHYRAVWATPVTVPTWQAATAVPGGLTPLKQGGSFQTKNLRLAAPDGAQYVLRSVDKDATKALPEGLRNGPVGRLMKDQTSVIHPYGAFIVPPLAEAAGVYHTNPRLVYVAQEAGLGEFQADFANALYLLEERPEGDQRAVASFGRSRQVVSSREALEQLLSSNRHQVEARQYLRSRLFDMWLGDWSRREDQWRWATFAGPDSTVRYRAIPRDRDHAFFKFDDGLLTRLISYLKPNYQSFGRRIKARDVAGLNRAARPLDASLLVYLSEQDFQQVADSLQRQVTDAAIGQALQTWPPEIRALSGEEFGQKLRSRREQLPAVAATFYRLLAREVEVPGTNQREHFVLEGLGEEQLRVSVYAGTAATGRLLGQRTLDARHTRRLRLFGLGGDDVFTVRGPLPAGLRVEVYDGAGQDQVEVAADRVSGPRVRVYDSGDGNEISRHKALRVQAYKPAATEFDAAGWLLRHRLY